MLPQRRESPHFFLLLSLPLSNPPFPIDADELRKKSLPVNGGQSRVEAKKIHFSPYSFHTSPSPPERETFPISSIAKHEEGWWKTEILDLAAKSYFPICAPHPTLQLQTSLPLSPPLVRPTLAPNFLALFISPSLPPCSIKGSFPSANSGSSLTISVPSTANFATGHATALPACIPRPESLTAFLFLSVLCRPPIPSVALLGLAWPLFGSCSCFEIDYCVVCARSTGV